MVTQNSSVRFIRISFFASVMLTLSGCLAGNNDQFYSGLGDEATSGENASTDPSTDGSATGSTDGNSSGSTDGSGTSGSASGSGSTDGSGTAGGGSGSDSGTGTANQSPTPVRFPQSPFDPAIAFYSLGGSAIEVSGQGNINSAAAIFDSSLAMVQGQAQITGDVYLSSSSQLVVSGQGRTGQVKENTYVENPIVQFAADVGNWTASESMASITLSSSQQLTITAASSHHVVQVNGALSLTGSSKLILSGSATDVIVLNVYGNINVAGQASMELRGGLTADHVIINNIGSGSDIMLSGDGTLFGTFMGSQRGLSLTGQGNLTGAVAARGNIVISGQGAASGINAATFQQ